MATNKQWNFEGDKEERCMPVHLFELYYDLTSENKPLKCQVKERLACKPCHKFFNVRTGLNKETKLQEGYSGI